MSTEKLFLNNGRLKRSRIRDMYKMIWLKKSLKNKLKDNSEKTFHTMETCYLIKVVTSEFAV